MVNSKDKLSRLRRKTCSGQKLKVRWPGASEDKEGISEELKGTAENKLNHMGEVIYNCGKERFGVC